VERRSLKSRRGILGGEIVGSGQGTEERDQEKKDEHDRPGQGDRLTAEPRPVESGPAPAGDGNGSCFGLLRHPV
jgi:hypothetical protein